MCIRDRYWCIVSLIRDLSSFIISSISKTNGAWPKLASTTSPGVCKPTVGYKFGWRKKIYNHKWTKCIKQIWILCKYITQKHINNNTTNIWQYLKKKEKLIIYKQPTATVALSYNKSMLLKKYHISRAAVSYTHLDVYKRQVYNK